jgi:hypothetical protein
MTDIAIDKDGVMIGISFDNVYRIDPDPAGQLSDRHCF